MPDDKYKEFNAHQIKVGEQIESLIKSVFLLSGSALTISIGVFNSPIAQQLSAEARCALKVSWGSFFASIMVLILSLSLIVFENYRFGMHWFKYMESAEPRRAEGGEYVAKFIPVFLVIGILLFLSGMSCLAWTAIEILDTP